MIPKLRKCILLFLKTAWKNITQSRNGSHLKLSHSLWDTQYKKRKNAQIQNPEKENQERDINPKNPACVIKVEQNEVTGDHRALVMTHTL